MLVKSLSLNQFKNHPTRYFQFSEGINCFVGNNGVGKTNVLDALHYVSMGKSFLGNSDRQNITKGSDFFSVEAEVSDEEKINVIKIQLGDNRRKLIKKNDKIYDRLADHIGFLPSVVISPYDQNLISDASEARRRFLDSMIAQTDSDYLYHLVKYQKAIKQRNALLKAFAKNRYFDGDSLEIYDGVLLQSGQEIYEKRKRFNEAFYPWVQKFYQQISEGKEKIEINYQSDLSKQGFEEILKQNLEKDRILTYTSRGVHKDDLEFLMGEDLLKKIGSQGQQKTFLVSLKLAQMQMILSITGKKPILLLDDIFDKLDDHRVGQLITLVNDENFGQIFITDTHKERTQAIVERIDEASKIFELG